MKNVIRVLALSLVMVMMLGLLVSCGGPNSDPKKAKEALEDADYEVIYASNELEAAFMGGWYDGCEAVILASNEDDEGIYIWYFEEKDDADDAWEDIEEFAKELQEEAEDEDIDLIIKKSGKMIYVGSKQAIKDAK